MIILPVLEKVRTEISGSCSVAGQFLWGGRTYIKRVGMAWESFAALKHIKAQ